MTLLLDLAVRSSCLVLIGLLASTLLRRRSAALRHWVLAAAVFAAIAALPLSAVLPAWVVPMSLGDTSATATAGAAEVAVSIGAATPQPPAVHFGAFRILAIAWIAGVAAGLTTLLAGFCRLAWLTSRAERLRAGRWASLAAEIGTSHGVKRPVALFQTDAPEMLATWGLLRPRVLLPAHARLWTDERARVVLLHEIAHVRRGDWFVQIGAEALRILFWFNPLFWLACTRLRRDSEQACDDAVLGAGVPAREYAAHLLDLARSCRVPAPTWVSAVPMARPSTLERRIAAMLNPDLNRQRLTRRVVTFTAVALLAVTVPTAALRTTRQAPGALTGAVYDPTGAVLPGVALTLEDAQQLKLEATTDASGRFEFPPVAAGHYVLEASLAGFRPLRYEFDLRVDRDWNRAITLQVGTVREEIVVSAPRGKPDQRSAPQAQSPSPLRVGGNIRPPTKVHDVKPVYPDGMRAAGVEGVVPMEAIIADNGTVQSVRVLSAQVHPELAIAAADAVRQWRFNPTLLNGKPVEVVMTVTVQFKLSD